ncbi:MAG: hypothetical protein KAT15_20340, partial [Bacteroidales bacterium]|nr:hypothetical protein [Bacteroidales bacterium]
MIQGPYHLYSIGILLILFYLLSLLMVRVQLLTTQLHKKFWNSLLLLFFTSTALLGLLLAIKVNYKLDLEWIDRAMQWHVDLGIGLALVSAFHLTRHLGYYKKLLERAEKKDHISPVKPHLVIESGQVRWIFILLGFISIIAQLVLLREFIKTFHGNELVIGIFLAIWMMLTAAGAWAGSAYRARISWESLMKLILFMAGFPLVIYFVLIGVTRIFFLPGYEPGMFASIFYMILLIIPFTLISGFLFAYISRSMKSTRIDSGYYMLDALGSLAGGVLFGLILVFFFNNIQVLVFLFLVTLITLILVFRFPAETLPRIVLICTGTLLMALVLIPGINKSLEEIRYRDESVLATRDTPYGNLTFTSRDEQVTVYLDRNPVVTSIDPARNEETVHYPALQRERPRAFLLVGGGLSGFAGEVQKYNPDVFDYCEVNTWVYRMGQKHLPSTDLSNI